MNTISEQLNRIINQLEDAANDNDWDQVELLIKELEILKEDMETEFPIPNEDWEDDDL